MPVFKYVGRTRAGSIQQGEIEAKDKYAVASVLRRRNILVKSIKTKPKDAKILIPRLGRRVKDKDLVVFTRQFSTMIDSGLPLVQCLEILSKQADNKHFAKIIDHIRVDIESGSTYTEALKKHPKIFNELYVNLVGAGEAGGILDNILNRLSAYLEKSISLRKKIKSALIYPISIIVIATIVVMCLMVFVIPVFANVFQSFKQTLPLPTRIVIDLSSFIKNHIVSIISFAGAMVVLFSQLYKKNLKIRRSVDSSLLKLPIFGVLIQKATIARFTRTLGTLVNSGVPIIEGLEITAKATGNKVVEESIISARKSIKEGQTIAEPLSKKKVFPPMVIQMINVGENTGTLDSMLSKIADFYENEVDTAIAGLTSLLEPLIIAFLGVVVGFIVIAMYLPIFRLASIIK